MTIPTVDESPTSTVGPAAGQPPPTPESIAQEGLRWILKQAGINADAKIRDVSEATCAALTKKLTEMATPQGRSKKTAVEIPIPALNAFVEEVKKAQALDDKAALAEPATEPQAGKERILRYLTKSPEKNIAFDESTGLGRLMGTLAQADHAVNQALRRLGGDPQAFGAGTLGALKAIFKKHAGADLMSAEVWSDVLLTLAGGLGEEVQAAIGNVPQQKTARSKKAADAQDADVPADEFEVGSVGELNGNGAAKSARSVGDKASAMSAGSLFRLLTSELGDKRIKPKDAGAAAQRITELILKNLGAKVVTLEQRDDVLRLITALLSPGKSKPLTLPALALSAYQGARKIEQDALAAIKAEADAPKPEDADGAKARKKKAKAVASIFDNHIDLCKGLGTLLEQQGGEPLPEAVRSIFEGSEFAQLAVQGMTDLVAVRLNADPKQVKAGDVEAFQGLLTKLTAASAAAKTVEAPKPPDETRTIEELTKAKARMMVKDISRDLQLDLDDAQRGNAERVLTQIFTAGLTEEGAQKGGLSNEQIFINANRWLAKQFPKTYAEHLPALEQSVAVWSRDMRTAASAVDAQKPAIAELGEKIHNLEGQLAKAKGAAKDPIARDLEASKSRFAEAQQEFQQARMRVHQLEMELAGALRGTIGDIIRGIADPAALEKALEKEAEEHRGKPSGADPETGRATVKGLAERWRDNSRKGPHFDDSVADLRRERTEECQRILDDPTLNIQDKIFYFMLVFVMFLDRERELKLEEMMHLDSDNDGRKAKLQKAQKRKQELEADEQQARDELQAADAELQKIDAKLEGQGLSEQARAALEEQKAQAEANVNVRSADLERKTKALEGQEETVSALEQDQEKSPKSREIISAEIDRITQLRSQVLNMARSIGEEANKLIDKIFR